MGLLTGILQRVGATNTAPAKAPETPEAQVKAQRCITFVAIRPPMPWPAEK